MGKSYVENSLKRFLKRKVKITLGVVVSFLITGMVAFAEPVITGDGVYIPYDSWVAGIGQNNKTVETAEITGKFTDVKATTISSKDGNIVINFKNNSENKEITIANTDISNTILKNVNNALILGKNNGNPEELNLDLTNDDGNYGLGFSLKNNAETENHAKKTGEIAVNRGEIKENYKESLTLVEPKVKYFAGQVAEYEGIVVNKGVINTPAPKQGEHIFGQIASGENSVAYNYGIIKNQYMQGQRLQGGALGYNYGLIINNGIHGQWGGRASYNYGIIANNGSDGQSGGHLYNYGIIANNGKNGQSGGEAYNYGIIANNGDNGQTGKLVKNYGVIANNGSVAQYSGKLDKEIKIINYGLIKNNGVQGQVVVMQDSNKGDTVENYGIIANSHSNKTQGQVISRNVTGYNYGIIANVNNKHNIYSAGKAYNYGLLYNTAGYGIVGAGENNGIIFSVKNSSASFFGPDIGIPINNGVSIIRGSVKGIDVNNQHVTNNGVEINAKNENDIKISIVGDNVFVATNQNDDVVKDKKFAGGNLAENTNLFVDRYTTNGKLTDTVTLDNTELKGNHITTVLGKDDTTDKAVISADDDLTLNNSSIVGYFEKTGTLLTVNGDLTLSGESVINAISGNGVKDVAAVILNENGTLTIEENSKVLGLVQGNGTAVLKDNKEHHNKGFDVKELEIKTTQEKGTATTVDNLKVTNGVVIAGSETSKDNTKITFGNNINIVGGISFNEHGTGENLGADITLGDGQTSSDKKINIDSITLGTGDDVLTINNVLGKVGEINGNGGDDTVNLKNSAGTHDTFDYKLKNIDTLDLGNSAWKIGANADITHNATTRADGKTTIQNGTLAGELQGTAERGVEFVNKDAVNRVLGNSTFGDNAKFQMNIGKDMKLEAGAEYDIEDKAVENLKNNVGEKNITASAIFTKATEQGKDIRVKTAEEMKIDSRYSGIYEEMLENASSNSEILDVLNSSDASSIANAVNGKGALGDTLATTGYKITRDISNSFMSAVNEWGKKANKGEWLANAKYINSDVEYDGANNVKGYDSDIKSMAGMIEYGVSDNTSLGIALGGGDTEIDVKGAGTLKGDNYYIGAYAKHSVNGFDLTGNLGYTISDLEVNGEGSADSSAITLGGYVKRDIALTETVRLEPNLSFTYDYIMQDNAEGSGVKADNKDIHVFEAGAGMNIVKGFNFEKGLLELEAGVKYSMADVNRNEETVISVYGIDNINLGNPEVDKTRGTAHVGFDYEHTTGFGVNGKYEMMWSDSGDDSRITAGVSYRF